jgi:dTDP-4-amino-4,6-dideoxygalactose transaminase
MRVPLLDLRKQYPKLAGRIRAKMDAVLESQCFILGEQGAALEKAICAYTGAAHAIGVSSGTDALLAILMALEIGPGDAVLTSGYTFFATASSIARVGARPVFVDIDPATYNISPAAIQRYIAENCQINTDGGIKTKTGEKIRAIVPVHLFGLCCAMDAIREISERYRLDVIEDAAQALGAEYRFGKRTAKAGTMGKAGFFSFYPSKNLGAAGDAGMIVCREKKLAARLRAIRNHGMGPRYYHQIIGGNFRMDEIQAAVLNVKLPYLESWSAARRTAADSYRKEFVRRGLTERPVTGPDRPDGGLALPAEPYRHNGLTNHHIYHQYVIRTEKRDQLRRFLSKRQVGTAVYYPLGLHEQKCFSHLSYRKGDLLETEKAARKTLALPIYPEISLHAQRYVVDAIFEFFR